MLLVATHPNLKGQEYTEDDFPYSTVFRSSYPILNVQDQMNVGYSNNSPPSVKLFNEWYINKTGYFPQYQSNGYWGALDILEGAIYRVSQDVQMMSNKRIDRSDIITLLKNSQVSGMYGRIIFDAHRINTPTPTIAIQLYPTELVTFIVGPSSQSERPIIYPIPTWSERVYIWQINKGDNFILAIILASICSFILVTIIITIIIHRNENDIRILQYLHMVGMCIISIITIWSCVFLWQADMNQIQCQTYAWLIYLPMSMIIQLMNMKAYRLSVFLHSENSKRLKKLTHTHMLILSIMLTSITAVILMCINALDPPVLTKQVIDYYRPMLDIHTCERSKISTIYLYLLFIEHILFSIGCVISVRNGTGEFRDGVVMKEAFTIFWVFMIIAYIMQTFALDAFALYILRVAFISIGLTFFCFRILVNRCYRHWVPQIVDIIIKRMYNKMVQILPGLDSSRKSSISINSIDNIDGPMYSQIIPDTQNLNEMHQALCDPTRSHQFRTFSENALVVENVDFLLCLIEFEHECGVQLMESSKIANTKMYELANKCYDTFIKVGSSSEVNISSSTRQKILEHLKTWNINRYLLTPGSAQTALDDDPAHHIDIFDYANKEISVMLYQNLWNKFRASEIEEMMNE
jgi:hypothetical protein